MLPKSGTGNRAGHFGASKEGPFVPGFKEKEIKGIKLRNLILAVRPPELGLKREKMQETSAKIRFSTRYQRGRKIRSNDNNNNNPETDKI